MKILKVDAGPITWQARHPGQCEVILPAPTTAPHPTFTQRRFSHYSCSCVCHGQPGRLLRNSAKCGAEEDDRQAAACPQRCGKSCIQHRQVLSTAESVVTRQASLVGRRRVRGVQVSAQHGRRSWVHDVPPCVPCSCTTRRHLRSADWGQL